MGEIAKIADIIGCIGVFLFLATYTLLQLGRMKMDGFLYSFLNMIASFLVLISLFEEWNLAAAIMEMLWAIVSAYGISRYFLNLRKEAQRIKN